MHKSGIYIIINCINGKFYVGSAVDISKRWREHRRTLECETHYNDYLQGAWAKHGGESFYFGILEFVANKCDLITREQFWLDELRPFDRGVGYNICSKAGSTLGFKVTFETKQKISRANSGKPCSEKTRRKMSLANSGRKMPEEVKKKISIANKGRVCSEEAKKNMSKAQRGKNHPMYGKHHSEETKRKMSEVSKGKQLTEETKQKISEAKKGKYPTEETRQRLSRAQRGRLHSEETKQRMSENKHPKFWACFGKLQTLKEWALEYGFVPKRLRNRVLSHGWSLERALTAPIVPRGPRKPTIT